MLYKSLDRPSLCDMIVREIEQHILGGQLKPGDCLPPERDLAQQFRVSRTAVREAIKVLAEKHLVTVLRGKGVIVAHPSSAAVTSSLELLVKLGKASLVQLTEARRIIEPEIAALAAERATPEQMQAMEAMLNPSPSCLNDRTELAKLDLAFHRLISEAAGNHVIKAMLDSIQVLCLQSMRAGLDDEGAVERARSRHIPVFTAIKERNAEAARRHMREHLDTAAERQRARGWSATVGSIAP